MKEKSNVLFKSILIILVWAAALVAGRIAGILLVGDATDHSLIADYLSNAILYLVVILVLLFQLEEELREYGFIKVNKACLLNISMLKTVKNVNNSRLEAELINGDRIHVSRTYIPNIKKGIL